MTTTDDGMTTTDDAMTTTDDALLAVLDGPSHAEVERLLHLIEHPTGDVTEDPIDVLRTRTVLTVAEFAEIMQVGRTTAYEMIARNDVPTVRIGKGDRGIRVLAQPLARLLGDVCSHCGREGGA